MMIKSEAESTRSQASWPPTTVPSSLHQPPSGPGSYQEEVLQRRNVDPHCAFQLVPSKLQCVQADQPFGVHTCHRADVVP